MNNTLLLCCGTVLLRRKRCSDRAPDVFRAAAMRGSTWAWPLCGHVPRVSDRAPCAVGGEPPGRTVAEPPHNVCTTSQQRDVQGGHNSKPRHWEHCDRAGLGLHPPLDRTTHSARNN